MIKKYDEFNKLSVLEYAKKLEGKTLREALSIETLQNIAIDEKGNKGRYGQKLERYYFGYDNTINWFKMCRRKSYY